MLGKTTPTIAALLSLVLAPACSSTASSNSDTDADTDGPADADVGADESDSGSTPGDADGGETTSDFEGCRGEATDPEVDANVVITQEYGQSLHEMVACGGLAVVLCQGVISGIINAIINSSDDATPNGWGFDGDGIYRTGSDGVDMTTSFFLAEDFEGLGASGDLVTDNVFLVASYFVNPVVSVDFTTGATELQYDSTGPLVELLGYGATPPNPLPLGLNDISTIEERLGGLEFESTVVVDDVRPNAIIQYHTVSPRQPATGLVGGSMRFDLVEASGVRADLTQDLIVDEWDIEFSDGGGLTGDSVFRVEGGHFDYAGVASFDDTTFPDTTLSCP